MTRITAICIDDEEMNSCKIAIGGTQSEAVFNCQCGEMSVWHEVGMDSR
jgi:hypothetical protein